MLSVVAHGMYYYEMKILMISTCKRIHWNQRWNYIIIIHDTITIIFQPLTLSEQSVSEYTVSLICVHETYKTMPCRNIRIFLEICHNCWGRCCLKVGWKWQDHMIITTIMGTGIDHIIAKTCWSIIIYSAVVTHLGNYIDITRITSFSILEAKPKQWTF